MSGLPEEQGVQLADVDPRLTPYCYVLPPDRIARQPAARREDARLLVAEGAGWRDHVVSSWPDLLGPEDLVVVNNTAVLPARVYLRRASGARIEALLLGADPERVMALLRPGRRVRAGERLAVEGADDAGVEVVAPAPDGAWWVAVTPSPAEVMARYGHMPLPPYLERADDDADRERYQTVYARHPGAVAAPTAGLHLSEAVLARLATRGVGVEEVTLHVGIGTFRPLRSEDLTRGTLHEERCVVSGQVVAAVARARARGGRVVAVGTTTLRALESAAASGVLQPMVGETSLFVQEGYPFRVVDALLTNFHLPATSLLMLVCAFGGHGRVMAGYEAAIARGYRFYSYGDAMFLSREPRP